MIDTIWPPSFEGCTDPKYIVLIQSLRGAVRSGQLPVGEKLPPVRELAWQLRITPGTVARAYKLAVEEGFLETTVGARHVCCRQSPGDGFAAGATYFSVANG